MASKKSYKKTANKAVGFAQKHRALTIAVIVILVIIIAAAVALWFVKPDLYHKFIGVGEHSWSKWEVTDATCVRDGFKTRKCTVCGEREREEILSEGHKWGTELTVERQPDCGTDGYGYYVCENCSVTKDETLPKTGKHDIVEGECTVCGYIVPEGGTLEGETSSAFSIHFLELGNKSNGDCILIDCGETEVLIDAGSEKGSAAHIKNYLDEYVDGDLDFVISTHSDSDHVSAFIGNKSGNSRTGILYQYKVGTFIRFDKAGSDGNGKPLTTNSGGQSLYSEYLDAVAYAESRGTAVYTAGQCYDETGGAKRQYYLDKAQTVSINILYNYYYYNSSSDENNYSVVTLLTEELEDGNRHYLFTGDLEEDGESKMVDYYKNPENSKSEYDILPEVVLYKAGHHGSKTSSTLKLLEVIKPQYVAVCCSCGAPEYTTVNANTFPTQTMIDNVGKYTDKIYVTTLATGLPEKKENGDYVSRSYGGYTSMNGDIVFYIEDGKLKIYFSNNDTILKDTDWFKENRVWNGI